MKKQVLFTFILAIVATMCTGTAHAQTKYELEICGTQVTSANCKNLSVINGVEGKVSYDPEAKILTLDNATIKVKDKVAIYIKQEMKIKVVGKCKVDAGDRTAISSTKWFRIYSERNELDDQCLDVVGGDCAIYTHYSGITIENCTVNAKGTGTGGVGIAGAYNDNEAELYIKGKHTRVTAEGTAGSICDFVKFKLTDCAITQPKGAKYDKTLHGVALDGKLVKEKVVIESVTMYRLWIADQPIHSANCDDLTAIDGVKGMVSYNPDTKTLTLKDATISAPENTGIYNENDGLTICLIGNNTITSERSGGIYHVSNGTLTIISPDGGRLTVKSETGDGSVQGSSGIANEGINAQLADTKGTIIVIGCTLEVTGKYYGFYGGKWEFDHCTIRVKGGGYDYDTGAGSISYLREMPKFTGCKVTGPNGAYWKKHDGPNYETGYCLFDMDDKIVTDWVTIADPTDIDTPTADTAAKQGIYTLSGVRLQGGLNSLPKGVYIVNGRKMVKQ